MAEKALDWRGRAISSAVPSVAIAYSAWPIGHNEHPFAWTMVSVASAGWIAVANAPRGASRADDSVVIDMGAPRVEPFHNRVRELPEIERHLTSTGRVHGTAPALVGLHGDSGAGTTTLAREYAFRQLTAAGKRRRGTSSALAFLIDASSAASTIDGLERLCVHLGLTIHTKVSLTIQGLWRGLENYDRYLLVYDGVRSARDLDGLLPVTGRGSLLWTTSEPSVPDSVPDAPWLRVEPLAQVAEDRLEPLGALPDAAALLLLFQRFAPARVPLAVFRPAAQGELAELPEPWLGIVRDPQRLDAGLQQLKRLKLVEFDTHGETVQAAAWARTMTVPGFGEPEYAASLVAAVALLVHAFPGEPAEPPNRSASSALLAHVQETCSFVRPDDDVAGRAVRLQLRAARYEHARDLLDAAAGDVEHALVLAAGEPRDEQLSGVLLTELALIRFHQARLDEAFQYAEKSLRLQEPETVERADALTVLHLVQRETGEFDAALTTVREARGLYERLNGMRSRKAGEALRYESRVLWRMGDFERAGAVARQALEQLEVACGPGHLEVGLTLTALGMIERDLGSTAQARATLERALDVLGASEGDEAQESALKAREYLAEVLVMPGGGVHGVVRPEDAERAEALIALVIDERRSFDARHPNYAMALLVGALVKLARGQARTALDQAHTAGLIYAAKYAENHPYRALPLEVQAKAYAELRDLDAARRCASEALALREPTLGPEHPYVCRLRDFLDGLAGE